MPTDSGVEQDIDFIASTAGLYDTPRYRVRVQGESHDRLQIKSDGTIVTGDGTADPTDTVATGAGFVAKSLYDANTVLYATTDDTPAALTVGASTVVGRRGSGGIVAISYANLLSDLGAAPVSSPTFTGNPVAPTQTAGNNSTRLATTAYADALVADAITDGVLGIAPSQNAVFDALALKAPLANPTFTGTVTTAAVSATGNVRTTGSLQAGVTSDQGTQALLAVGGATAHPSANTTAYGAWINPVYPSTSTSGGTALRIDHKTAAASFVQSFSFGVDIQVSLGAGSSITNWGSILIRNPGSSSITNNIGLEIYAQSGATTLNVAASLEGGTTANLWLNSNTASAAGGIAFGTARDVILFRNSSTTLGLTGGLVLTGSGTQIGTTTANTVAFHGSTAVAQRAGAAQAAVITTAATITTPYGYATQAQADAIVALVNELRAALVEKGLIKGSA